MKPLKLTVLFLLLSFSIISIQAQDVAKNFKYEAFPSKLEIKKGESFTIRLNLSFGKDWYTYSMNSQENEEGIGPTQTEITIAAEDLVALDGKIKAPKPKIKFDKGFEMNLETYTHKVSIDIPVKAKKDLNLANQKIIVVAYLQLCFAEGCIPPTEYKIKVQNKVYPEAETLETANADSTLNQGTVDSSAILASSQQDEPEIKKSEDNLKNEKTNTETTEQTNNEDQQSLLSTLLLAMAAGAAALLTPCVFPMVPITVSFFTKRTEQTKGKGLRDALVYALGIIVTFTALGFFFSLIFGASGVQDFTSNPWVSLFIAAIFIFFGLSLFGAYEIQIPTSVLNKLNAKSMQGTGISSVVLMGLTFSLASFSCTGPLVAAALVSASQGEWFYPIVSMAGFSTVLAAPFFLLALFPTALTSLPRAGGWMNNIKGVLGFVVLAVTFKYINAALSEWDAGISRPFFIAIWVACGLLITLYTLGLFKLSHDTPVEKVGTLRLLFAILFASVTFYLFSGLFGGTLGTFEAFLPAPDSQTAMIGNVIQNTVEDKWYENYDEALKAAKEQNKPLFIDFTGKHCPNCRLMERTIFPVPEINSKMNQMIKLKLITDLRKEPYISNKKMQLEKYNTVAIPYYVILSKDEKVISQIAFTTDPKEFENFLSKGIK